MKLRVLTLFFLIVLISCSKDKDPAPEEVSIVGKWEVTNAAMKLLVGDTPLKEYMTTHGYSEADANNAVGQLSGNVDPNDVFKGSLYEFKADGKLVVTSDNGIDPGTWKLSSNMKTLEITYDDNPPGATALPISVQVLTASQLQIDLPLGDNSDRGFTTDIFIALTFKRL